MKHGVVLLPEHEWKVAVERWRAAEELGYDHAWTYDHLMWRWFADRPWYGSVPTLTAAAMVTDTIGLGTLVATPNFRHPAVFAKDLATLDDIAGGRVICGLGSGAPGFDTSLLGQPEISPRERAERFEEFVGLLDTLLTGGDLDRASRWYTVRGATFHPRAGQGPRLPFAVAAAGPRGMALTARSGQYWITSGPPNDFRSRPLREIVPVLRKQMSGLDSACEREGRDPADVRRLFVTDASAGGITASRTAYEDAASELEALGFTDLVVHWPRPDHPYQGDERVILDFAQSNLSGRP
ncbi:LLM class flavin-dependent oxidoreductase [Nocardiopsis sp. NPDC058631]|uniref:LLM class flavin-dependent oxidoreductase n=1 Tax=Nocardiopsis sp. NPDC058631 TaxID=3346566 RepID=UPI00365AF232